MRMVRERAQFALEEVSYLGAALRHRITARLKQIGNIPVLVNGSPKSGTTWMRNMVASLPGYRPVGNLGSRIDEYLQAAPGDVFHGHHAFSPELRDRLDAAGIRRILMLRDPRDQSVSRMFHLRRDKEHSWHLRFMEMDDDAALMACIEGRDGNLPGVQSMVRITESWQIHDSAAIFVKYEALLEDPEQIMSRVFSRLDIPVSDVLNRAIVTRNRFRRLTVGHRFWKKSRERGESDERSHFRKGIQGDWINHFQTRHKERFKSLAGETLIAWGYESDLEW